MIDLKSSSSLLPNPNLKWCKMGLRALLLGPIYSEAYWLVKATKGGGTKESLLTEAIFGRKNHELLEMKAYLRTKYHKTMEDYVRNDLSYATRTLFDFGIEPDPSKERNAFIPSDDAATRRDVDKITRAMRNPINKQPVEVCEIMAMRTEAQIRDIESVYLRTTHGKSFRKFLEDKFAGHMRSALLYILDGATNKAERVCMTFLRKYLMFTLITNNA